MSSPGADCGERGSGSHSICFAEKEVVMTPVVFHLDTTVTRWKLQCHGCGLNNYFLLLPTGSEEREVGLLWVVRIPVAILPSCQDMG